MNNPFAQPGPVAAPPLTPPREPERSKPRARSFLLYVVGVLLVIVLFTLAGIRSAGVSPAKLFSHTVPTPTVAPYPTPRGTPLFADSFFSDAYGWNLQSVSGRYTVTLANGTLSLENDKNSLLWELLPGTRTFSDFKLFVDAELSKGDQNNGYGIYIRGTSNQRNDLATYYRFELYGDGSYAIFKGSVDANGNFIDTRVVNYTLNPAILKAGKLNHIIIVAKGSSMSLIVNNQPIRTLTDNSYTSGSIALFVSNLPEAKPGAQAQFSQLAIYPVGS